jgi:hypothetical protein
MRRNGYRRVNEQWQFLNSVDTEYKTLNNKNTCHTKNRGTITPLAILPSQVHILVTMKDINNAGEPQWK